MRKALAFRRRLKLAEANASFRHSTRAFLMKPAALKAGNIFAQVII